MRRDLDGNTIDLADYIGKQLVLLEFWATWCPLCAQLAPRIDAAYERFGDEVAVITVAVGINQDVRSIRGHLEDHPVPGLIVFDGDGRAAPAFEAPGTSYVVILDAEGRVAYTGGGGEQDIEGAVARVVSSSPLRQRSVPEREQSWGRSFVLSVSQAGEATLADSGIRVTKGP